MVQGFEFKSISVSILANRWWLHNYSSIRKSLYNCGPHQQPDTV